MLKKTIKFVDYFGEEREQDFYFNLTKSELAEMELSSEGGIERLIEKIIQTHDRKKLVGYFKNIILKSYGVKSDDGLRFVKSKEISEAFEQCPAYDVLFMELVTDTDKVADFFNGIVPKDISDEMKKINVDGLNPALAALKGKDIPPAIPQNKDENN